MTTQEIEIVPFNSLGKIVAPAPELVAKMNPEPKARLMAMLKANIEAEDAESGMRRTEKELFAAVSDAQRARAAFEKLKPQTTHVDELRRVIAARAGRPLPPAKVDPKAEPAAIAADEAEALCGKLRGDLEVAKLVLKDKRATLSVAILAWQGLQPKRDTAYLVRENLKRETERRLARVAQGLSPDEAAVDQHAYSSSANSSLTRLPFLSCVTSATGPTTSPSMRCASGTGSSASAAEKKSSSSSSYITRPRRFQRT
jgi:hypothetical protein